jgi:hypothetical protein
MGEASTASSRSAPIRLKTYADLKTLSARRPVSSRSPGPGHLCRNRHRHASCSSAHRDHRLQSSATTSSRLSAAIPTPSSQASRGVRAAIRSAAGDIPETGLAHSDAVALGQPTDQSDRARGRRAAGLPADIRPSSRMPSPKPSSIPEWWLGREMTSS